MVSVLSTAVEYRCDDDDDDDAEVCRKAAGGWDDDDDTKAWATFESHPSKQHQATKEEEKEEAFIFM